MKARIVLLASFILLTACGGVQEDPTTGERYESLYIYRDDVTGCQYLKAGGYGGITPRMDADGNHICKGGVNE